MPVLKNVEVQWAQVKRPNKFGKFSVEAVNLTQEHIEFLKELGLAPQNKADDRGFYISFKRTHKRTDKAGNEIVADPPKVIDAKKRPFTGLIGNGSTANIQFSVFDTVNPENGKKVRSRSLETIQVLDLVHYESEDSDYVPATEDELEEEDGFEATGDESATSSDVADDDEYTS